MKLHTEHLIDPPELEVRDYLDQQGYLSDVVETQIVPSESTDKCYVVQKIETTKKPFERADVVDDKTEIVICSCDSARFHSFEGVDLEQSLDGYSACKHGRRAFRTEQAKADENQAQLFDTGQ